MPNVAVIGATGAVGDVFLRVAEQREFPIGELKLLATARSAGKQLKFRGQLITVEETSEAALANADVVFCSATSEASRHWGPIVRANGGVMIDDGSAYRMETNVPLVVPEINGDDLEWHEGIVSIPNCTTTPMVLALHAMKSVATPVRVTAATYQAVTGSGSAAAAELRAQIGAIGRGEAVPAPTVYPQQIAMNVLPQVDDFDADGYTKEELKMRNETRKILHQPDLPIATTCVRVPTLIGHAEVVHAEFDRPVDLAALHAALAAQSGIVIGEGPEDYATPLQAEGNDLTHVGRLRPDPTVPDGRGIVFWCVSDNLRKGAATNAIQIAEELIARNLLKRS
ncbi:MAG: aspartate-semialdehyde dehydrogenase [Chloroflexi bacterium]|nr:aspartate-semialdehyde dehydrogenase [Chloroflexota bacterium]MDA1146755.1 aspartate-semialdehyde dehydrogenase [Chloroflexota bacterium]MQC82875.1 aspartate-semialdehyde dehydrogenase [Chloroflexota bacterium]